MAKRTPEPRKYKAGDAASKYVAKLGLSAVVDVRDVDMASEEYRKACIGATKEAMGVAAQLMLLKAREYAPKSSVHRAERRYQAKGKVYSEPLHLWQALYKRAARARNSNRLYAMVKSQYGYANMVIGAAKKRGVESFLLRARAAVLPQMVDILKREWPSYAKRNAKARAYYQNLPAKAA